jgi:hypothetical protein
LWTSAATAQEKDKATEAPQNHYNCMKTQLFLAGIMEGFHMKDPQ